MADNILHITNGDLFTERLTKEGFSGDLLTFREMLCEGPGDDVVFSNEFILKRSNFLSNYFQENTQEIAYDVFAAEFNNLNIDNYDVIFLWFEYDLFCHINLAAAIYFLRKLGELPPLFLICSGEIEGREGLFGLGELSNNELSNEISKRVQLFSKDVDAISTFWEYYSGAAHNRLKEVSFNQKTLPYFNAIVKAHLERFPQKKTGVNSLELHILTAINNNDFISEKQLLGFMLRNQGYYGFGDLQWKKIIEHLRPLFTEVVHLELNEKGLGILDGSYNAFELLKDNSQFGGAFKYDYFYNAETQQLEQVHAH